LARSGDPHSGTSQFYVNLANNLDLNPRPTRWGYAVFGTVVEGMEIIDEIGDKPTGPSGIFERNVPVVPIEIENIVLLQ
jgi:peptidyl-prolyl cis-trans isomerase A (cyclophilin A)/peptidyl-prolyl cis-trans isomerase B (cyclophilin B)